MYYRLKIFFFYIHHDIFFYIQQYNINQTIYSSYL